MLFEFDPASVVAVDSDGMAKLDAKQTLIRGAQHYSAGHMTHPVQERINAIIDAVGEASS